MIFLEYRIAEYFEDSNLAFIFSRLNYWLNTESGRIIDGIRWIYNTYEQWHTQFPWLSISTIRRIFRQLRESGIVRFAQHQSREWKQKGWYTIDYDRLNELFPTDKAEKPTDKKTDRCVQIEQIDAIDLSESNIEQSITLKRSPSTKPKVEEKDKTEELKQPEEQALGTRLEALGNDLKPKAQSLKPSLEDRRQQALQDLEILSTSLDAKKVLGEENYSADVTQKKQEIIHGFKRLGAKLTKWMLDLMVSVSDEVLEGALRATQQQARGMGFQRSLEGFIVRAIREGFQPNEPVRGESESISPFGRKYSAEFLQWYEDNKGKNGVVDVDVAYLSSDRYGEPLVRVSDREDLIFESTYPWISWRKIF